MPPSRRLGEGLQSLAGAGVGVGVSLAATRLLRGLLFGVSATDPWTFAAAPALLAATALAAAWLPARRAVHLDPTAALREE